MENKENCRMAKRDGIDVHRLHELQQKLLNKVSDHKIVEFLKDSNFDDFEYRVVFLTLLSFFRFKASYDSYTTKVLLAIHSELDRYLSPDDCDVFLLCKLRSFGVEIDSRIYNPRIRNYADELEEHWISRDSICNIIKADNINMLADLFDKCVLDVSAKFYCVDFHPFVRILGQFEYLNMIELAAFYGSEKVFCYLFHYCQDYISKICFYLSIIGDNPEIYRRLSFLRENSDIEECLAICSHSRLYESKFDIRNSYTICYSIMVCNFSSLLTLLGNINNVDIQTGLIFLAITNEYVTQCGPVFHQLCHEILSPVLGPHKVACILKIVELRKNPLWSFSFAGPLISNEGQHSFAIHISFEDKIARKVSEEMLEDLIPVLNIGVPVSLHDMFSKRPNLVEVNFPDGFDTSTVVSMSRMFAESTSLRSIRFGEKFNTRNVLDMSCMFLRCHSLDTLELPKHFCGENVRSCFGMFFFCQNLKELTLPEEFSCSSNLSMNYMFGHCSKLKKLEFPDGFNASNVIEMKFLFYNCSSLETVKFSRLFSTGRVTTMERMFDGCKSIKNIELTDAMTTASVTNVDYMFANCSSLVNITFPANFNASRVLSKENVFLRCEKLRDECKKLFLNSVWTEYFVNKSFVFL